MNNSKFGLQKLLPVFMSFIVMGFVDILGPATSYIQKDFGLSETVSGFLPSMILVWFFILGVPMGVLQNKYGKKNMLKIGMVVQALGLLLPFIHYAPPSMVFLVYISFILIGIGNTIIQVSANPLLQDVSPSEKLASYMSSSQFVKAIISFSGPIIASYFATSFGDWRLVLLVYGITSIIGAIWLSMTPIVEAKSNSKLATFGSCLSLLKNNFIALMALSIFLIVGAEVAINTKIGSVLTSKYTIDVTVATLGISAFFLGEIVSRLIGTIILNWIKPRLFLLLASIISLVGIAGVVLSPSHVAVNIEIVSFMDKIKLFFNSEISMAFVSIFIIGLGIGSMFPIIFSFALKKMPDRANEISGLLIMAVSGGAVFPPVMGFVISHISSIASLGVIGFCMSYILWVSLKMLKD